MKREPNFSNAEVVLYVTVLAALLLTFSSCTEKAAEPTETVAAAECTITETYAAEGLEYLSCPVDMSSAYTIYCTKAENDNGTYSCMKVYTDKDAPRE